MLYVYKAIRFGR